MRRDRASSSSPRRSTAWTMESLASLMMPPRRSGMDAGRGTPGTEASLAWDPSALNRAAARRSGRLDAEQEEERPVRLLGRPDRSLATGAAIEAAHAPRAAAAARG